VGPPKSGVSRTIRRASDTGFYSLFFILYKRTTNGRPYIDLFDLKTDDQWSPLQADC
jgi:hypothetical protein